jgi:hypothetical protein
LKNWNRRDEAGNFLPSLAVLGHPVAHSVSPQMHNAALAELAKKYPSLKDWRYFKFDIEPEELEEALELLKAKNFKGVNLTVPHKHAWLIITALHFKKIRRGAETVLPEKMRQKISMATSAPLDEFNAMHPVNTVVFVNAKSARWKEIAASRTQKTGAPREIAEPRRLRAAPRIEA